MLQSLSICNFALIDKLVVFFHNGLHVLTGETGAGKSIVVDALNVVLGSRVDRGAIRTGSRKSVIEAVFDIQGLSDIKAVLADMSMLLDEDQLILTREIHESGKSISRINGVAVQLTQLRSITSLLIDVHGQHEHQSLMDPKKHLAFLDLNGDINHSDTMAALRSAYDTFYDVHTNLSSLTKTNKQQSEQEEILRFRYNELHNASLKEGEEAVLLTEKEHLAHYERLINCLRHASENLSGAGSLPDETTLTRLKSASDDVQRISDISHEYQELSDRIMSVFYETEDISRIIANKMNGIEYNPRRMEEIDGRLDTINSLKRKYNLSEKGLLDYYIRLNMEINERHDLETALENLKEKHRLALKNYRLLARELSDSRRRIATDFEKSMSEELLELGMSHARFVVLFHPPDHNAKPSMPTPFGDDIVEFVFSANPGEPLKPIIKTASGGEISRIMLAIKTLCSKSDGVPCMVFDEIDTGISGRVAQIVAEKMTRIAMYKQVICVTHLPQIASMAHYQYLVEKNVKNGNTYTSVHSLNKDQRIIAIAKLISGASGEGESALEHAKALITAAGTFHNKIKQS